MTPKSESRNKNRWPPRRTPKRKRALGLLQQWADERTVVEYYPIAGLIVTGTISALNLDDGGKSFLFRNDSGIRALLHTDSYETVDIDDIPDVLLSVRFSSSGPIHEGFTLRPVTRVTPSPRDLELVNEKFRQWERLDVQLQIHLGNSMYVSASCGKVKELSLGRFSLIAASAKTIHILSPQNCTAVFLNEKNGRTSVTFFHARSDLTLIVTDGMESAEEIMSRLNMQTTLLQ
jgi:hypothetical protein